MSFEYILFCLIAYLLGSIPSSVWIGKSFHQIDVREHGSNNAGATNTFRVLGKKAGIIVLMLDIIKGVLAVLIVDLFVQSDEYYFVLLKLSCGILAVIGHIFPVFARFNGGKGVATSFGILIGIFPLAALITCFVFLISFLISRYVSLGALISAFTFPFTVIFVLKYDNTILMIFSILLSLTVIITHHKNIRRLLNGTENKMNFFKK
ncbi:MAG: glycerol-3-phosphate 1-O-acyltransferase PlsY [Flavobacteriia bacterium]|nr:glycerol-3-phosphate 1-O-acyltransferase PlsY [Flavobacteriia bacterium]